eukprot:8470071-Alexandrium_andersonii.AAC.1
MEKMHDAVDGQVRVLLTHIQHLTGKVVLPEDRLFAWAVGHAGWIVDRCVVRQDGATPYMAITGTPDRARLCIFGETVRYLHSKLSEHGKAQNRWKLGVWVGISDADHSHIILTPSGV